MSPTSLGSYLCRTLSQYLGETSKLFPASGPHIGPRHLSGSLALGGSNLCYLWTITDWINNVELNMTNTKTCSTKNNYCSTCNYWLVEHTEQTAQAAAGRAAGVRLVIGNNLHLHQVLHAVLHQVLSLCPRLLGRLHGPEGN